MNLNNSYIVLQGLICYAYHGVGPQEQIVGNEYRINLKLKVDFMEAAQKDDVDLTVSYADVYERVKSEMQTSSMLLENAALRIVERLFADFQLISEIEIELYKRNPPMGADIDNAGVVMQCSR